MTSFLKEKTVLVTGAGGFVGANLVRALLKQECSVHAFTRQSDVSWRLQGIQKDISVHVLDIADRDSVEKNIAMIRPDAVFHLATYGAYPSQNNIHATFDTNITGTLNLLEALEKVGSCQKFVNTGSSSEYGLKDHPMREDDVLCPTTAYAVTKAAQTLLVQMFGAQKRLPTVTLRLFSVFGPFEESGRLIADTMCAIVRTTNLKLSSPDPVRDFVFVEDVVAAFMKAAESTIGNGEIFNVGGGKQITLGEVVGEALRITQSSVHPEWGAKENARTFETTLWLADITKAQAMLGWSPHYALDDGLTKTYAWFRDNINMYDQGGASKIKK